MATISALWTKRSTRATTQAAFGKASPYSAKGQLAVITVERRRERLETILNSRSARVGQVSDLVDHQELLAGVEAQLSLEQDVGVDCREFAERADRGGEAHSVTN